MSENINDEIDDEVGKKLANLSTDEPAEGDSSEKNWSIVSFAESEPEADEYILKYIKGHHKLITDSNEGSAFALLYNDTSRVPMIAFLRHIAHLYASKASEDRIQRDITKIWQTYIDVAKTIKLDKNWSISDTAMSGLACMDVMSRFVLSAETLRSAAADVDIQFLRQDAPIANGVVGFGDEHLESWTEADRKEYKDTSPWWGLALDDIEKSLAVFSNEIPNDELRLDYDESMSTWDETDCGILRNLLSKELNSPPPDGLYGDIESYKSINAFAALLTERDNIAQGKKLSTWAYLKTLRLFRDALEEERGFKVGIKKQPDIGVLSSVMPIWITVFGRPLLSEIDYYEQQKDPEAQCTWMPHGELAAKTLKNPPILTAKRWKYWMSRCEEINHTADQNHQTTLKIESKMKFWKRGKKDELPAIGKDVAEDVEGTHGRFVTKGNLLVVHELMERFVKRKAADDAETKAYMKSLAD